MTLHVARPFDIPLTIGKPRLVAHARRIAELGRLYAAALPAIPRGEVPAFADLIPLAVAISHVKDLGIGAKDGASLRRAAWPESTGPDRMRAALAADAPRFEPGRAWGRCPMRGTRGGKCNERGRNQARWVTDPESGVWEWREMCDLHLPAAVERAEAAPVPAPNRGGVLAAVFPEVNVGDWYRWAMPGWTEGGRPAAEPAPVTGRPALRLVDGAGA